MQRSRKIITLGGVAAMLAAIAALYTAFNKSKDIAGSNEKAGNQTITSGPSSNNYQASNNGVINIITNPEPKPKEPTPPPPEFPKEVPKKVENEKLNNEFSNKFATFPFESEDINLGIKFPVPGWKVFRLTPSLRKFEFNNSSESLVGTLFLYPLWGQKIPLLVDASIQGFKDTFGANITVVRKMPVVFQNRQVVDVYFKAKRDGTLLFTIDRIYSGKEGTVQIMVTGRQDQFDELEPEAMSFLDSLQFKSEAP